MARETLSIISLKDDDGNFTIDSDEDFNKGDKDNIRGVFMFIS